MIKTCVFPGSFDPITNGHLDLINRAAKLFDEVIVAVLCNPSKHTLFSKQERVNMIEQCCKDIPNTRVECFDGLLVEYAKRYEHVIILRGIRDYSDWVSESKMALLNTTLGAGLETLFLPSKPELSAVSSSAVKEIASFHGDVSGFVPMHIVKALQDCYRE